MAHTQTNFFTEPNLTFQHAMKCIVYITLRKQHYESWRRAVGGRFLINGLWRRKTSNVIAEPTWFSNWKGNMKSSVWLPIEMTSLSFFLKNYMFCCAQNVQPYFREDDVHTSSQLIVTGSLADLVPYSVFQLLLFKTFFPVNNGPHLPRVQASDMFHVLARVQHFSVFLTFVIS